MRMILLGGLVAAATIVAAIANGEAHGPSRHGGHGAAVGPPTAYGVPGDATRPTRDVDIVMKEASGKMLFEPSEVKVKRGEQIRFRLRNAGALDHEFLLGTAEEIEEHADMMKAMPDMQHDDPNAKRLVPNAGGDLVWHFTTAGIFQFACLIPGHREAGMSGVVVVE